MPFVSSFWVLHTIVAITGDSRDQDVLPTVPATIYIRLQKNPDWSICMTATLLDFLMILALGILAGTGTGLLIGFITRKTEA